jgi:DNA-binding transcriptional ArsR family regulator
VRAARSETEALSLKHADRSMNAIRDRPGVIQAALGAALHLSPPNLSRILGALEANGLIERRREGRQKALYPNDLAQLREENRALQTENRELHAEVAKHKGHPRSPLPLEIQLVTYAEPARNVAKNTAPTHRAAAKKRPASLAEAMMARLVNVF